MRRRWSPIENRARLALLLAAALAGCAAQRNAALPPGDNSRNALDWQGAYVGTTPCADCPGIRTRIELREDGTFTRNLAYLDSNVRRTETGSFEWDSAGARITLAADGREVQRAQVGENALFLLDRNGERITGERAALYRLAKIVNDERIENRRWRLVELDGQAVAAPADREVAFFELDGANARIAGNASCNRFSGTYELAAGNRLSFGSDLITTRMACGNLEQERQFLEMLTRVESYTLGDGTLALNGADAAPLARLRSTDQ